MNVGENIKKSRKKKGLTQKKLAELTGIAEITIRQYESGKYEPKRENLRKISEALDLKQYDLLDDYIFLKGVIKKISKEYQIIDEIDKYLLKLNLKGLEKVLDYIQDISLNKLYTDGIWPFRIDESDAPINEYEDAITEAANEVLYKSKNRENDKE